MARRHDRKSPSLASVWLYMLIVAASGASGPNAAAETAREGSLGVYNHSRLPGEIEVRHEPGDCVLTPASGTKWRNIGKQAMGPVFNYIQNMSGACAGKPGGVFKVILRQVTPSGDKFEWVKSVFFGTRGELLDWRTDMWNGEMLDAEAVMRIHTDLDHRPHQTSAEFTGGFDGQYHRYVLHIRIYSEAYRD